jgi:phosphopantetheinyl transferase
VPLTDFRELNDHTYLGFWNITETIPELELLFGKLRPEQEICVFKSEIRQKEWLASRILAYLLLQDFTSEKHLLSSNENGKPQFENTNFHVSISQSGGQVAVILSDTFEVGIDIEILRDKILKIAFKFLSEKELAFAENNLEKTCLYWSAKETLYKMYSRKQLLFIENLHVNPIRNIEKGTMKGEVAAEDFSRQYNIHYEKLDNFILTYCLAKPQA